MAPVVSAKPENLDDLQIVSNSFKVPRFMSFTWLGMERELCESQMALGSHVHGVRAS